MSHCPVLPGGNSFCPAWNACGFEADRVRRLAELKAPNARIRVDCSGPQPTPIQPRAGRRPPPPKALPLLAPSVLEVLEATCVASVGATGA